MEEFVKHETDFNATTDELPWIVATTDLGYDISPLLAGRLMDWMDRKPSTTVLWPFFIVSWALYTARLLTGMGKGISYTVVLVYLGEIESPAICGALGSVFCLWLHFGSLIIGPLVSYRTLNVRRRVGSVFRRCRLATRVIVLSAEARPSATGSRVPAVVPGRR